MVDNITKLRMELARISAAVKPLPSAKVHLAHIASMDASLVAAQKKVLEIRRRVRENKDRVLPIHACNPDFTTKTHRLSLLDQEKTRHQAIWEIPD